MSAQKILVLVTRTLIAPTTTALIAVLVNRDSLEMAYLVVVCLTPFCFILLASSLQNKVFILSGKSMHLHTGSHANLLNMFAPPSS